MPRRRKRRRTPAERAHITRKRTYRKIRNGISFLDCTVRCREKCSEGEFLGKYMEILNHQLRALNKKEVELEILRLYGSRKVKEALKYADHFTIHISSHGDVDKNGRTYLDLSHGRLYAEDLRDLWKDFKKSERPLLLVLSACGSGHKDLIRALSENGCRYCIAPVFDVNWEHAALFSTFFYTYLFLEQMRPVTTFRKTIRSLPELSGKWKLYDKGKDITV